MSEKLKKIHKCKVVTLKNQYRKGFCPPKNGFYLFCQNISNLQYHDVDGYYCEVNVGRRGGVGCADDKTKIFDIAINPYPTNPQNIRDGFVAILKEKILNDVEVYRKLVEQMIKDGKITKKDIGKMYLDVNLVSDQLKKKVEHGKCDRSWEWDGKELLNRVDEIMEE